MRFCAISRSFFRGFRPLPATAGQTGGQGRRTAAAPEPRTDGAAIAHGEEPPLARQAGLWCPPPTFTVSFIYIFCFYCIFIQSRPFQIRHPVVRIGYSKRHPNRVIR
ncbi:hypothetical protein SXCC_00578 [Gluconacetobacter sp. SXCC-1]|nr:hypothetical protein SXCC_00578 [Gluconacetobacter sp. SXCC-1]